MKLYLSSFHLGNQPDQLACLVGPNKHAAVILNAQDHQNPIKRNQDLQREVNDLTSLGLVPEEIDLRQYFGRHTNLETRLSNFGLIWVRGGNVFVLRRAMQASGFDQILLSLAKKDTIVYGGFSAGVCVLAPSLHGLELVDDPAIVPSGYPEAICWDGLGLIEYGIAPHYRSNHPESLAVEQEVAYFEHHQIPYRTLRDGEVILTKTGG